jgi:hypothetical protein
MVCAGVVSLVCGFFQRISQSEIHAVCQETPQGSTMDGGSIYVMGHKVTAHHVMQIVHINYDVLKRKGFFVSSMFLGQDV